MHLGVGVGDLLRMPVWLFEIDSTAPFALDKAHNVIHAIFDR